MRCMTHLNLYKPAWVLDGGEFEAKIRKPLPLEVQGFNRHEDLGTDFGQPRLSMHVIFVAVLSECNLLRRRVPSDSTSVWT